MRGYSGFIYMVAFLPTLDPYSQNFCLRATVYLESCNGAVLII